MPVLPHTDGAECNDALRRAVRSRILYAIFRRRSVPGRDIMVSPQHPPTPIDRHPDGLRRILAASRGVAVIHRRSPSSSSRCPSMSQRPRRANASRAAAARPPRSPRRWSCRPTRHPSLHRVRSAAFGDDDADERFGHQGGSVVADHRMERKVSGRRQWDAAGVISYHAMTEAVSGGYATSSTDTGHVGNTMALRARASREVRRLRLSLRSRDDDEGEGDHRRVLRHARRGCRTGMGVRRAAGRASPKPAAIRPTYDAVIAGAPAIDYMQLHAARMALNGFVHRSGDSYIPPEKYPAIHRAALNACDALDGVEGWLDRDPARCRFDPRVLECKSGDDAFVPHGSAGRNGARHVRANQESVDGARRVAGAPRSPAPSSGGPGWRAPNHCETRWSRSSTWSSRSAVGLARIQSRQPISARPAGGRRDHQLHGSEPRIVLRRAAASC